MTIPTGRILHLQRLSTEDGPGIRTTVFFKGCPLHCRWCHNPESISPRPQVHWLENRCIGCGACLEACPQTALTRTAPAIVRDRSRCHACGQCVQACPANAHELLGVDLDAAALVKELLKDRAYFTRSGGGVTLSGGEPTRQPEFAAAVASRLQAEGVSVALDTCGLCLWDAFEAMLPHVDVILYDLKLIDLALHRVWTGASNQMILDNLRRLAEILPQRYPHTQLWLRTPLIPVATCSEANLHAIGAFLAQEMDGVVRRWELCAFNNLCRDKYRRLDMDWEFAAAPLLSVGELAQAGAWARESGANPEIVFLTGAAAAL